MFYRNIYSLQICSVQSCCRLLNVFFIKVWNLLKLSNHYSTVHVYHLSYQHFVFVTLAIKKSAPEDTQQAGRSENFNCTFIRNAVVILYYWYYLLKQSRSPAHCKEPLHLYQSYLPCSFSNLQKWSHSTVINLTTNNNMAQVTILFSVDNNMGDEIIKRYRIYLKNNFGGLHKIWWRQQKMAKIKHSAS